MFEIKSYEEMERLPLSKKYEYAAYWQAKLEDGNKLITRDFNKIDWYDVLYYVETGAIYDLKLTQNLIPLDDSDQLIGEIIVDPRSNERFMIIEQDKLFVHVKNYIISYRYLQEYYTRLDGSRFEKLAVEE